MLGGRTRLTDAIICPCLIGPKGLMRRSKLGAVGDAANAESDKVIVRNSVEQLMWQIMRYDWEFRREEATSAVSSNAMH
jgi:hypothetical protein